MTINARLAVVIVNYGAADFIIEHLVKTLAAAEPFSSAPIYIADNASPGGDLEKLIAHIESNALADRVTAFSTGGNLGFAGGNNAAFEKFGDDAPDFVLFLNPDAWPEAGAPERLAQTLMDHPDVGLAAPRITDEHGNNAVSYFNFPRISNEFGSEAELDFLQRRAGWSMLDLDTEDKPINVDWVSGAAFLLRMKSAASPPMDDRYFLYFEETDMMRELARGGWGVLLDPRATVVHVGGLTTGAGGDPRNSRLPKHWYQSWARYYVKQFGRAGALLSAFLKLAGAAVFYVKFVLKGRRPRRPKRYLRDFMQYALPSILTVKRD